MSFNALDLDVLLANEGSDGVTTSDTAIRREIIKQIIYKKADFISVGTKIVGVEGFDNLDVKYTFPSDAAVEYPVPEGSGADLSRVTWGNFGFSLDRAEGRFMITDEATIRGVGRTQWQMGIRRLAEAMAKKKDTNILNTLDAGYGNTFPAAAAWQTATAANITTDISTAINHILNAHGVSDSDLSNIVFVVPIKAWSGLMRILEIEGSRINMMNWIKQSYGIDIMPTKTFTTTAIAMIKGPDTAIHGVLNAPNDVPLVEQKRHTGVGLEYVVRQFFATSIVPEEDGATSTDRIVQITGIAS